MPPQSPTSQLLHLLPQSPDCQPNGLGLAGALGQMVRGLYAASEQENEAVFEENFAALTQFINQIYSGQHPLIMNATLEHGLAGLGVALHCLVADGLIENDLEPLLINIDSFVYEGAKKYFRQGNNTFGTGGEGGLYYLSLRQAKNPITSKYVAHLMRIKQKMSKKIVNLPSL